MQTLLSFLPRRVFFYMRKTDYIVVGLGIAGIAACERLYQLGRDFMAIDAGERTATLVAGGVVNPVVLKRFTPVWNAAEFMDEAQVFYKQLASRIDTNFLEHIPLYRILATIEEQNDWTIAGDDPLLSSFLASKIVKNQNQCIHAHQGFGAVTSSFRIDTMALINGYKTWLENEGRFINETFSYSEVIQLEGRIQYRNIEAKKIIFAEGAGLVQNPFFTSDWLVPKKGEYVTFRAPDLGLTTILKGPFFIIPLGDALYQAGATFAHGDTSYGTTENGRKELIKAIAKMINCPFEIIDQIAGMRPTIKDRRPILGPLHNEHILFLNGLGTRGLLMAPLLSKWLLSFSENSTSIPIEVDIKRVMQ